MTIFCDSPDSGLGTRETDIYGAFECQKCNICSPYYRCFNALRGVVGGVNYFEKAGVGL